MHNQSAVDGAKLRAYREARGLTQDELRDASGVSQSAIAKIETGQAMNPRYDTIKRLADALGIAPGDLSPGEPQEPAVFQMVRDALNTYPGGADIPLAPEDIRAQLKSVGGALGREELQSVVDYVAFTRWRRWRREHGLDA
jgi:transcriptional regulator with XRE-family HTH domain